MRIVREIRPTAKKTAWQLTRVTHPDGRVQYHTGDALRHGANDQVTGWGTYRYRGVDVRYEPVPGNLVLEGALRPRNGCFVDRDTGLTYWANDPTAFAICEAAITGQLPIVDGHIVGRFTFKNVAGKVNICLYDDAADDTPPDAPDLSDFVRSLGAEA